MKTLTFQHLQLCITLSACTAAVQHPPPRSAPGVGAQPGRDSSARSAEPAPTPVPAPPNAARFLVHADDGSVELRSVATGERDKLIAHTDFALYDPALELVWFIDANQLQVVDLRTPAAPPVVIARDMQDASSVAIRQESRGISDPNACDGPAAALSWTAKPSLSSEDGEPLRIEASGKAWLAKQDTRPARALEPQERFLGDKVALPERLLDCEDEESCGATVRFGPRDWQLVLVVDKSGGDCWTRSCLLRNPSTDKFSSPPKAARWDEAERVAAGSCGPYRFEPSGQAFLVERMLCVAAGSCAELGGEALGWLIPGKTVGE